MDIKIKGISFEILEKAVQQAKEGRLHKLAIMDAAISSPRGDLSQYAPRLTTIKIPVDMIGAVIGPGGKNIRNIVSESGAEVNIEDDWNDRYRGNIKRGKRKSTSHDRTNYRSAGSWKDIQSYCEEDHGFRRLR